MINRNRFSEMSVRELVELLEAPEGHYTPEAIELARTELKNRKASREELLTAARTVLEDRIDRYMRDFDVVNDELVLPTSRFLNEEEVKLIFLKEFKRWKNENDDLIPDGWKYAIGAGFI
ncbi:MAG: hypothetical protein Kow0075_06190 [Salibacteraceae bacterium]